MKKIEIALYFSLATACMVIFVYLTPPILEGEALKHIFLFENLAGDLAVYLWRFIISFLFLGLIPFLGAIVLGYNFKTLGFTLPFSFLKSKLFILLLSVALLIGIGGRLDPNLQGYYPYSKTLVYLIKDKGFYFLLHALAYFFLYYLPWEFFFRGFLIIPLLDFINAEEPSIRSENRGFRVTSSVDKNISGYAVEPCTLAVACVQVIPSTLLHFGHPITETLGAIPAGILFGYLVLKTRSILPGLILHGLVGIALDMSIIFIN
ncbi:MAG: hypothetical protein DRP87_01655 [Spirochaetes bacterium]|nr:MAG: hypothetical protein DRP87_01655 [Spirochaetota bacterium]